MAKKPSRGPKGAKRTTTSTVRCGLCIWRKLVDILKVCYWHFWRKP